jgi:hypothetical protein
MRISRLVMSFLVLAIPVLAQQPAAPAPTVPAARADSLLAGLQAGAAATPGEAAHKPFRLDIALVVNAAAPPPEATEALRGQLQLISSMRRGWYTGPPIKGPIFQYWNAADYTVAAGNTYYAVPFYMRASADYYFGPPAGMASDLSVAQIIGGIVLQGLMTGTYRR